MKVSILNVLRGATLAMPLLLAGTSNAEHNDATLQAARQLSRSASRAHDEAAQEVRYSSRDRPGQRQALIALAELDRASDNLARQLSLRDSRYVESAYLRVGRTYRRADQAMRYANFSYRVDREWQDVESDYRRLRREYDDRRDDNEGHWDGPDESDGGSVVIRPRP